MIIKGTSYYNKDKQVVLTVDDFIANLYNYLKIQEDLTIDGEQYHLERTEKIRKNEVRLIPQDVDDENSNSNNTPVLVINEDKTIVNFNTKEHIGNILVKDNSARKDSFYIMMNVNGKTYKLLIQRKMLSIVTITITTPYSDNEDDYYTIEFGPGSWLNNNAYLFQEINRGIIRSTEVNNRKEATDIFTLMYSHPLLQGFLQRIFEEMPINLYEAQLEEQRRINSERDKELEEQQKRVNHFLGLIQKEMNEINRKYNKRLEELSSNFLESLGNDSRMKQTTSFMIKKKKRGENNG